MTVDTKKLEQFLGQLVNDLGATTHAFRFWRADKFKIKTLRGDIVKKNVRQFAIQFQYAMIAALVLMSVWSTRVLAQDDHSHTLMSQHQELTPDQKSKQGALLKIVRQSTRRVSGRQGGGGGGLRPYIRLRQRRRRGGHGAPLYQLRLGEERRHRRHASSGHHL